MVFSESAIISRTPCGVERRDQALVDLEQAPLAGEPVLAARRRWRSSWSSCTDVDDRLGGVAGEDRQRGLVLGAEPVAARRDTTITPVDDGPRSTSGRRASIPAPRSEEPPQRAAGPRRRRRRGRSRCARRPSRSAPRPPGRGGRSPVRRSDAAELALECDRLAHPGLVVDAIDADGVVVDQPLGPSTTTRRDPVDVARPIEAAAELLDRPQPAASDRTDSSRRALPTAVAIWSAKPRASAVSSAVQSWAASWYSTTGRAARRGR